MRTYSFDQNYANDETKREQLYQLFDTVFNIPMETFRDFYSRGFWDDTYRPFTYFDGEKAIANASIFEMTMNINGDKKEAVGIQSVMTHPEYRGMGLMKNLFKEVLQFIDERDQPSFLMTSSPELYTPFGFRSIQEHYFKRPRHHQPIDKSSLRKVNVFNKKEVASLQTIWQKRALLSNEFMPLRYQSSFFLNMYNPNIHDLFYFSDELNTYLVFDVVDGTLELYDIIGEELPDIEDICSFIPEPFENIAIYFSPDRFSGTFEAVPYESVDHFMVRGRAGVESKKIKLPITAEF